MTKFHPVGIQYTAFFWHPDPHFCSSNLLFVKNPQHFFEKFSMPLRNLCNLIKNLAILIWQKSFLTRFTDFNRPSATVALLGMMSFPAVFPGQLKFIFKSIASSNWWKKVCHNLNCWIWKKSNKWWISDDKSLR